MEVEYIFAELSGGLYSVSKFAGGAEPLETYEVMMDQPKQPCECGAWRSKKTRPCKHAGMIQAWIDAGKPETSAYSCTGLGSSWNFQMIKGGGL